MLAHVCCTAALSEYRLPLHWPIQTCARQRYARCTLEFHHLASSPGSLLPLNILDKNTGREPADQDLVLSECECSSSLTQNNDYHILYVNIFRRDNISWIC